MWSFKNVLVGIFLIFLIVLFRFISVAVYGIIFLAKLYRNSVYWMGFSTNLWGLLAFVRFGDARL